ncbi:AMP-binding protein [Synechococcales cyanobacterium C]|uniref:AMP-binding protein n=1 Tax=Petrachloros mirabilis ULC683 TaxID=2781853 RepID=A0A8K1ZZ84_9CYAN|nr:AMP-binding protein [Petrachloros mirabilis]NCJ06826.1 AMP-binding protein [Petrachloros mirabilis ULC683]
MSHPLGLENTAQLTLPELLRVGCDRTPNPRAFNQWTDQGWQSLSNQAFQTAAQEIAQGLRILMPDALATEPPRVALLMHSDLDFCLVDMGGLLAHWVTVPIDLTETCDHVVFILKHTAARVLVISDLDLLAQMTPYLWDTPDLEQVIVATVPPDWAQRQRELLTASMGDTIPAADPGSQVACLHIPLFLCHGRLERPCPQVPPCIQVRSLAELRQLGRQHPSPLPPSSQLDPHTLATLIYTPSATGELHGVMLSHGNLAANALAAFASFPDLRWGQQEVALSFLPLTHIFARVLLYGHLYYGHSLYLSTPHRVMKHLPEVRPTVFATVPLLLDKIHSKIEEQVHRPLPERPDSEIAQLWGSLHVLGLIWAWATLVAWWQQFSQRVLIWVTRLAEQFEIGSPQSLWQQAQRVVADLLVYWRWRRLFGGRLRYLLTGGAALNPRLANFFGAAGLPVFQGYGLTESCVVSFNRRGQNRAGTVGLPIPGADIRIVADGELWVRSPYTLLGYYRNPEATAQVLTAEGWLRTGDRAEITAAGFLKIIGCKKSLFKLSTGKYVTPLPLETRVQASPLVAQAIAVGAQRKFCAMLIFPHREALAQRAHRLGLEHRFESLLRHPQVLAWYQALVDQANHSLAPWSTVKQFRLVDAVLTVENQLLHGDGTLNRDRIYTVFAADIEALYASRPRRAALRPSTAEVAPDSSPLPIPVPYASPPPSIDLL